MSGTLNPSGSVYTWPKQSNPGFRSIQSEYLKTIGKSRKLMSSFPVRPDRVPEANNKVKFDVGNPIPGFASGAMNRGQEVARSKAMLESSLKIQSRL